ncbi:hypothetical protein P171DRAFT_498514 [Karstenula rhodostoma CBS 690.94]|uniref:Uncharacterized protein n=1 Tax=Karstenula rhodostoma CBS 690.94 TaxID=1392251 RepID=A0A9P4PEX7_9PLEO|nr:hypothetical protein P171DRAFT_498514 [Karstenula rhodostoma CBS 690.94]
MDLDGRFQGNRGTGGGSNRIILLGDGTEITTEAADADMFDNDDEDKDRDFQVDRSNGSAQNAREATPGPQGSSAKETTESPSSVKTEKSEESSAAKKDTTVPEKLTGASEK